MSLLITITTLCVLMKIKRKRTITFQRLQSTTESDESDETEHDLNTLYTVIIESRSDQITNETGTRVQM